MSFVRRGLNVFLHIFRKVVVCRINGGRRTDSVNESGSHPGFTFDALRQIIVIEIRGFRNAFLILFRQFHAIEESGPSGIASDKPSTVIADCGNIRHAESHLRIERRSRDRLSAALASACHDQSFSIPFRKGFHIIESAHHAQEHSLEIGSVAARFSEIKNLAQKGFADSLKADFEACGMPVDCPFKVRELTNAMRKDKKAEGDIVHFVLPFEVGHVETRDLSPEEVASLLEE